MIYILPFKLNVNFLLPMFIFCSHLKMSFKSTRTCGNWCCFQFKIFSYSRFVCAWIRYKFIANKHIVLTIPKWDKILPLTCFLLRFNKKKQKKNFMGLFLFIQICVGNVKKINIFLPRIQLFLYALLLLNFCTVLLPFNKYKKQKYREIVTIFIFHISVNIHKYKLSSTTFSSGSLAFHFLYDYRHFE